jgi:hypothetical protein
MLPAWSISISSLSPKSHPWSNCEPALKEEASSSHVLEVAYIPIAIKKHKAAKDARSA